MNNNWQKEEEDMGQEVSFSGKNSFSSPRPSVDTKGLMEYIKSLDYQLPALLAEQQLTTGADEPFLRVMQLKDIITGLDLFPGYVFGSVSIVTQLSLDTLKFDSLVTISHDVFHITEMLGICPTIQLWEKKDYNQWIEAQLKTTVQIPYKGAIKIITFNELLF